MKPRQPTQSDLAARGRELEKVNGERLAGLHCAMHGKPEATARWRHDGWSYVARLYYSNAAHGGVVLITGSTKGQNASTAAHYFDDWANTVTRISTSSPPAERTAMYRIRAARNAANDRDESARRAAFVAGPRPCMGPYDDCGVGAAAPVADGFEPPVES